MEGKGAPQICRNGPSVWPRLGAAWGLILLIMPTAACGTSGGSASNVTPSAVLHGKLSAGGLERSYRLFRPALGAGAKVPLVIALHELGTTGDDMAIDTKYDDQAGKGRFIVVYPDGVGGSWNAGTCCSPAAARGIDDVTFIRLLIDQLIQQQSVDGSRVFVTGLSNGAAMAYRLACELADRIRAIASVSGGMLVDSCQPVRPVSVLEIHGSNDLGATDPAVVAAEVQKWATRDGCTASPSQGGSSGVQISTWDNCRNQSVVKFELIQGQGHRWFAKSTAETWQFFMAR